MAALATPWSPVLTSSNRRTRATDKQLLALDEAGRDDRGDTLDSMALLAPPRLLPGLPLLTGVAQLLALPMQLRRAEGVGVPCALLRMFMLPADPRACTCALDLAAAQAPCACRMRAAVEWALAGAGCLLPRVTTLNTGPSAAFHLLLLPSPMLGAGMACALNFSTGVVHALAPVLQGARAAGRAFDGVEEDGVDPGLGLLLVATAWSLLSVALKRGSAVGVARCALLSSCCCMAGSIAGLLAAAKRPMPMREGGLLVPASKGSLRLAESMARRHAWARGGERVPLRDVSGQRRTRLAHCCAAPICHRVEHMYDLRSVSRDLDSSCVVMRRIQTRVTLLAA